MVLFIATLGGLLLMMGHHSRSEALFYYFRLEDQVPEDHLLRLIDRHVNFHFVRAQLKDSYSDTGRPSVDRELMLRMLLIGYLYGITSERKLVEELRMHLAWRWFTGLSGRTYDALCRKAEGALNQSWPPWLIREMLRRP
jgi:transposase